MLAAATGRFQEYPGPLPRALRRMVHTHGAGCWIKLWYARRFISAEVDLAIEHGAVVPEGREVHAEKPRRGREVV